MTMIPEGKWKARGVEATLAETSEGNPQVAVDLEFTEADAEWSGQHRTWYGSFSEKAMNRTFDQLRLLGWKGDDLADLSGIDGAAEVWVTVVHEEDQEGNLRDRAAWINGSPGLAVRKPMDEGGAKAFAEKMKGHVLAHGARTKGAPASAKPAAAASGGGTKKAAKPAVKQNDFAPEESGGDDPLPF